jgi:hypothetical protein
MCLIVLALHPITIAEIARDPQLAGGGILQDSDDMETSNKAVNPAYLTTSFNE